MKVKPSPKRFNTPVSIGTVPNPNTEVEDRKSVDEEIDAHLEKRSQRLIVGAKLAELEATTEKDLTNAARARQERQLVEAGKIGPRGEEGSMEGTEKKIEDAAEVAAQAASAGVNPEDATALGTGKSKVVVIKPAVTGEKTEEGKGGWSVVDGKPVKDPEGEYSFNQALKVAAVEKAKGSSDPLTIFKWMKEEGLLTGSKGDDFMSQFTAELAHRSVESLVSGGKSNSGDVAETLRSEMATLRQELRTATDPVESAKRVRAVYDSLKGAGFIPEPSTGGTSLDDLKETHRHEEKMDEIRADREHKERLTDIAGDIPEKIGRGIGEDMRRGRGRERSPSSSTLDKITCDCGTAFVVPPEAMEKGEATCPKCGMVYRGEK